MLALIASLMVLTTLTETFYVAAGGDGPTTAAPVGSIVEEPLGGAGLDEDLGKVHR